METIEKMQHSSSENVMNSGNDTTLKKHISEIVDIFIGSNEELGEGPPSSKKPKEEEEESIQNDEEIPRRFDEIIDSLIGSKPTTQQDSDIENSSQ